MKKRLLPVILLLSITSVLPAQEVSLSGYVSNKASGEKIIGATIISDNKLEYAITNSYGYYSLRLKQSADSIGIQVSYVGHTAIYYTLVPTEDIHIDFELEENNSIGEVIVSASESNTYRKRKEISVSSIPVSNVKALPSLGGESDLLKSLQLMPGVQSGSEASSSLYIRGGSPDQNLMVIDDVPIYYVNHLGGFVSTFNSDAINSLKLVKGGFPAHYGSRLSSVLDIKMKEGNMNEFHGNAMIGMIASKIMVEGPIKKDTTSYIFSLRRFMYDLITRPLSRLASEEGVAVGYNFYDLNAKINHRISYRDRLYFSFYSGDDKILNKQKINGDLYKSNLQWGNILGSFRWNHLYNEKLFSNLTLYSTRYRLSNKFQNTIIKNGLTESNTAGYLSGITDISLKVDFDYYAKQNYKVKFGGTSVLHYFNPNTTTYLSSENSSENNTEYGSIKQRSLENAVYLENEITFGNKFFANIGARTSSYNTGRKNYFSFEPRLLTTYILPAGIILKASYASMNQYVHLLTGTSPNMQNDIWVPVTEQISPSRSQQLAIGLEKSFGKGKYELSLEAYYKNLDNLIAYKEGVAILSSTSDWQSQVETKGKGKSKGIEVLFQKTQGSATGWLAYTFSETTRQFDNKNNGRPYPFKYDRTHNISLVYIQKINKRIDISATWVYGTGNPYTLAESKYLMSTDPEKDLNDINAYYKYGQVYNELNSYRMRAYHKLDVGINFRKKVKRGERTWNFSIYNLYNRQNPYYYFLSTSVQYDDRDEFEIPGSAKTVLKQQSYFPFFPSFSYSLKF